MLTKYSINKPAELPDNPRRKWRLANAISRLALIIVTDNKKSHLYAEKPLQRINDKLVDKKNEPQVLSGLYAGLAYLKNLITNYPVGNKAATDMAEAVVQTFAQGECALCFDGLTDAKAIKKINYIQLLRHQS